MKSKEQFLADIYKKAEENKAEVTVTKKSHKRTYAAMIGAATAACIILPVLVTMRKPPTEGVPMPISRTAEENPQVKNMMERHKEAAVIFCKVQSINKENSNIKLKLHVFECYNQPLSGEYEVIYEGQLNCVNEGDDIIAAIIKEKDDWKLVEYQCS